MASFGFDLPVDENVIKDVNNDNQRGSEERKYSLNSASTMKTTENFMPNEKSDITYHYLTFTTPLALPSFRGTLDTPVPPAPNLKRYTSPFDWPESRKSFIVWLSCIATLFTAYTAGSYAPATSHIAAEWHVGNTAAVAGITTFCSGFAIAPMFLAPLSEINGRYPVFVGAGILFVICQICCAATQNYPGMLIARFGAGCGGSVFSTMVGGVVSDLYHAEGRNMPMALFSGAALSGTGLGPLVSGFVAQNINWRWVFWLQAIVDALLIIALAILFRETRGSILLSRKAQRLNAWYAECEAAGFYGFEMAASPSPIVKSEGKSTQWKSERIRWKVKSDEERESIVKMISISVSRPFHLLITEPVVFFFSLWVAFAWAVLYLTFGAITLVFSTSHHFNTQQANAVFAAMMIGAFVSTVLSIYQDRFLASHLANNKSGWLARYLDMSSPEARLYFACIESTLLPISLFWFGWASFPSVPWIVPTLAVGTATMGIYSIYLATFNYLADSYHRYASSALAAQSFCRNMLGGIFPLVTVQMFNGLTFQGAGSLLGGIALLLSAVPWVLVVFGPRIRAKSKFASGIV